LDVDPQGGWGVGISTIGRMLMGEGNLEYQPLWVRRIWDIKPFVGVRGIWDIKPPLVGEENLGY